MGNENPDFNINTTPFENNLPVGVNSRKKKRFLYLYEHQVVSENRPRRLVLSQLSELSFAANKELICVKQGADLPQIRSSYAANDDLINGIRAAVSLSLCVLFAANHQFSLLYGELG